MLNNQNPFPGLRPFESNEKHLFFGRERHIAEILRKLDLYRFVSVVGNSGSGKSSLVRAGLLPTLENEGSWIICIMRPGKDPISEVAEALIAQNIISVPEGESKSEFLEKQIATLRKSNLGLIQILRRFVPAKKRLLLLVDQFEEIFRFTSMGRETEEFQAPDHFVDTLLASTKQKDVPIYVLLTLRSDFLGDCEQFMGLPEAINDGQFLVPRMNREDLTLCLTGPVSATDGKISPRLVQQLLNEVGHNPDQLPILQHVLMRSWEQWHLEGRRELAMDIVHYEQTGGMDSALSNHAEEAYSELDTKKRKNIARVMFKTITVKGTDNRGVRRPTQIKKIAEIAKCEPSEVIAVADVFRRSDRGFIMPPQNVPLNDGSILDISHESLMRAWNRLGTWVQDEADSSELYNRITESALLYEQEKAGLWRDPDLQISVDWRSKNEPNAHWAEQYNNHFAKALRFIEASENEKMFVRAEKSRRRRVIRAALIAFLVALSALSIWAVSERNNSLINAKVAVAEKIKADEQKKLAEEQTIKAEANYQKAKTEEERAHDQQMEAEKQRKLALTKAEEARIAKQLAEAASGKAIAAKSAAEKDRRIAENQKSISDSLRIISETSEKKATRLRILALSQNVAIKSRLADESTLDQDVKALLALQAYQFNKNYGGKKMDPEIYGALFSAVRMYQNKGDYEFKYHGNAVKSLCYNAVNGDLASAGDDGRIIISPTKNPSNITLSPQEQLIYYDIDYNSNGSKVAISCDNHSLYIFNSANLLQAPVEIKGLHREKIMALKWYGDKVITASTDSVIRIIDLETKKIERSFTTHSRPESMELNQSKNLLFVGCSNGSIFYLNLTNKEPYKLFAQFEGERINCLSSNWNGTLLAVGTNNGKCVVLDVATQQIKYNLYGHKTGLTNIQFNYTSNELLTACRDQKVRMYLLGDVGSPPIVFNEHTDWVEDVAFSPDGQNIASCGKDKAVRIYPIDLNAMTQFLAGKLNRNLTIKEWENYIGNDVAYVKTIEGL
ncbi:MAG: WD40 repeat protein [Bacteroidia bacterium]|jgi:WD40 repeat protein